MKGKIFTYYYGIVVTMFNLGLLLGFIAKAINNPADISGTATGLYLMYFVALFGFSWFMTWTVKEKLNNEKRG